MKKAVLILVIGILLCTGLHQSPYPNTAAGAAATVAAEAVITAAAGTGATTAIMAAGTEAGAATAGAGAITARGAGGGWGGWPRVGLRLRLSVCVSLLQSLYLSVSILISRLFGFRCFTRSQRAAAVVLVLL